jgi:hypothetical protein
MSDRWLTPLIALGLAFLVWLYTHSRNQESLDQYLIPVEIALEPGQAGQYELRVKGPGEVPVTFTGPPSRIRELRRQLQDGAVRFRQNVRVPDDQLDEARVQVTVRLKPDELPLPPLVRAEVLNRRDQIAVTLLRIVEKQLQVQVEHNGGAHVENLVVEPNTVLVRGPKEVLDREVSIPTELYLVPSRPSSTEPLVKETPDQVPLVTELRGAAVHATPPKVSVRFTLAPRQRTQTLDVPVHFLCTANPPHRPRFLKPEDGHLAIRVRGPAGAPPPEGAAAYVDLTQGKYGPGVHKNVPVRVWLPAGFQLDQKPPRLAAFELSAPPMPRADAKDFKRMKEEG